MGERIRAGTQIRDFWPDDTPTTMHCASAGISLAELMVAAQAKWPGAAPEDITLSAQHIQTHCLGYDRYDAGDHTDFIIATCEKVAPAASQSTDGDCR